MPCNFFGRIMENPENKGAEQKKIGFSGSPGEKLKIFPETGNDGT